MPLIASFYGIVIQMYFQQSEHNPPHVHARYGECAAAICIQSLQVLDGSLPPRALSLTQEWMRSHQTELAEMWDTQEFKKLPPLE